MRRIAAAALVALAFPMATAAGDLAGGYSFERTSGDDAVSRHGWNVSAATFLTGPVALVADAAGHYGTAGGVDREQLTLMAGPRLSFRRSEKYSPFLQALVGLARETASVTVLDVKISQHEDRLGFLLGGGLDVRLRGRWALRLAGDYERSSKSGDSLSGFRLGVGAAYRF